MIMKLKTPAAALAASVSFLLIPSLSLADIGSDTAAMMTKYYNDTRPYCNSSSSPAFMCSGILLRATVPASTYHSWNPSPLSVSNGGVSFSYLRADATFSKLAYGHNNGFTLTPYNYAPEGTIEPEVLCAFPADAATNNRFTQGCGDSQNTTEKEDFCQSLGITTAELWRDAFSAAGRNHSRQCAFDTRDNLNINGAKSFYEMIRAMAYLQPPPSYVQNELRLATWEQNKPLPIQSFFYTPGGLADAQADQKDWFKTNASYIPIIAISLPNVGNPITSFTYSENDQAVCEKYIEGATWEKRNDPGINREAWTLKVTPTQCGRQIDETQTNAAYAELLKKFGEAAEWNEENGGGMRRQLVCHLVLARNKPTWNLEPFRPNVSHQESLDADCNPVAKTDAPSEKTDLLKEGQAVIAELYARYNNKAVNCGTPSQPAYLCSGILISATLWPPVWEAPDFKTNAGGTIFSYLRADSKFEDPSYGTSDGFIIKPASKIKTDQLNPEVLCFHPMWNFTTLRDQKGCGGIPAYKNVPQAYKDAGYRLTGTCSSLGTTTLEQWLAPLSQNVIYIYGDYDAGYYRDKPLASYPLGCTFDVRASLKETATKTFNDVIKFRSQLGIHKESNVLILDAWPRGSGAKLPVEAFYYHVGGKANAQTSQREFYEETGRAVPIISITFPTTPAAEAIFEFHPEDQLIQ